MSATTSTQEAPSTFSAAGPALGYIVQVEYALLFLLQHMDEEDQCSVSIETLDDVTFHDEGGTPREKLQTKHHINQSSSLSNASSEIWKTLGNWITERTPHVHRLVLLSTDQAQPGSAASFLARDPSERDIVRADEILTATATSSSSQANKDQYEKYLSLSLEDRRQLLRMVIVLDSAVRADGLTELLLRLLRRSARAERRTALLERLRGWWHERALRHLLDIARGVPDRIAAEEVEDRIHQIAQSLRDNDLPIDFDGLIEPNPEDVDSDTRIFVEQLRIILMGSQRLRQCVYDHNRAYMQRSLWQREQLLHVGELETYDRRLQDEWRRHFTPLTDDDASPEEERLKWARDAFHRLDTSALPPIRREVAAPYIANGSLHILADRLQIGWHPDWIEHLRHRLDEVALEAGEQTA